MAEEDPKQQEQKIRQIVQQVMEEQKGKAQSPSGGGSATEQKIAVDCTNAHNIAIQSLHYCQQMGGKFSDPEVLNVLQDCAELCRLMDDTLLRQSKLKKEVAEVCKKACEECVKFCENFPEDEQLQTLFRYTKVATDSLKQIE